MSHNTLASEVLDYVRHMLQPIPMIDAISNITDNDAEVAFSLVNTGYYYLANVNIVVEYCLADEELWRIAYVVRFNNHTTSYGCVVGELESGKAYKLRLRLSDKLNPNMHVVSEIKDFTTEARVT